MADDKNAHIRQKSPVPKMKGLRQATPEAMADLKNLLADRAPQRDLLIEYLHLIQDHYGHLPADALAALAEWMKLAPTEIYEVASFYAHFDIIKEHEIPPPACTIRICNSVSCMLRGAEELKNRLAEKIDPQQARLVFAPCMGRCDVAPVVELGHNHIAPAQPENVLEALNRGEVHAHAPEKAVRLDSYRKEGGYQLLEGAMADKPTRDELIEGMTSSGLRGLGGAGFPAGKKWHFVRLEKGPRLMAINADEGEPGTFKDYFYLKKDPHRFLEGALIAAWVVEAERLYIYLRDEYPDIRHLLLEELEALEKSNIVLPCAIELRRGAGAYICGEESAMLESIEGKRGLPRHKPPFPSQKGLFGRPTLIHNVETVFWVRDIIEKGSAWFSDQGQNDRNGFRSFSVSGRVKNPGVKCAPAGITVRELIDDYCGGMEEGHQFKAYLPGGASGGLLPAKMDDIPLDFDTLHPYGCFIGSAAIVVFSDKDSLPDIVRNLTDFFMDESCGQCTPCRVGTEKALKLMAEKRWNKPLLEELAAAMADASICGLGQAAPNPILCFFNYFPEEIPDA